MNSYYKDNIVNKYFNNISEQYDRADIYSLINSVDPKYGLIASDENVDILSTRLYKLNKLLSKVIHAYTLNDKTILDNNGIVNIDDIMWNKLRSQLDTNNDFIKVFNDEGKQFCTGECKKYTLVKSGEEYKPVQVGGFLFSEPGASTFTKTLDLVQLILDVAGFIPGAGIVIDIVGTVLSLLRRDWMGALFSAINIIPFVGSFIGTPSKYVRKFMKVRKYHKYAKKAKKYSKHLKTAQGYAEDAQGAMDTYNEYAGDDGDDEEYAGDDGDDEEYDE
jgi:hypothetical protein